MLANLTLTLGEGFEPLAEDKAKWLVEVRVEMELSKPTRFALRFEDDICEDKHEIFDCGLFAQNKRVGVFATLETGTECLVAGPIKSIKNSSVVGGQGSWVEVHGEDRRTSMDKIAIEAKYTGYASAIVEKLLNDAGFTHAKVQKTLIEHKLQGNQLTQSATDLAFIEDVARRNNMDLWVEYKVDVVQGKVGTLVETAWFQTSPRRDQGGAPQVTTLLPTTDKLVRVHPGDQNCANVGKFDTRIDFDKPTGAQGFTMDADKEREVRQDLALGNEQTPPLDLPKFPGVVERKTLIPPKADPQEAALAKDALVAEQSWFVEADCSASLEQLPLIVRPHQVLAVENAGPHLSGAYQVMKATHVITATDYLMDFTLRANGMEAEA